MRNRNNFIGGRISERQKPDFQSVPKGARAKAVWAQAHVFDHDEARLVFQEFDGNGQKDVHKGKAADDGLGLFAAQKTDESWQNKGHTERAVAKAGKRSDRGAFLRFFQKFAFLSGDEKAGMESAQGQPLGQPERKPLCSTAFEV